MDWARTRRRCSRVASESSRSETVESESSYSESSYSETSYSETSYSDTSYSDTSYSESSSFESSYGKGASSSTFSAIILLHYWVTGGWVNTFPSAAHSSVGDSGFV